MSEAISSVLLILPGVNVPKNQHCSLWSAFGNADVNPAVDVFDKGITSPRHIFNHRLRVCEVKTFLRKAEHFRENPGTHSDYDRSVHFIRINLVRVMASPAILAIS